MTTTPAPEAGADDPFLWLEEVQGEAALAWVQARNAESRAVLQQHPRFVAMRDGFRAILDSADKIPQVTPPRRLAVQPVARRGPPARPVAAHHAGQLPHRRSPMGDGARPGRAGSGRG
jgi:hypothetical protein